VNTLAEALADEQVRARDMIIEVQHPQRGPIREVASPIKTAGAVTAPAPAPRLGQHTETVLAALLGYAPERIAALRAAGAFGR
jgi:crotonobetainyl-CoA:carnitine CoA-transferase CaiB-like acyl-CoA transferase